MMRLRHLVTIGPRPPIGTELHPDADVTFIPMEAIADGLGGLDISQTRPFSEVASGSYNYFAEGDLLLAKVTPCFENGKKALAKSLLNDIGYATSEVHVIRPSVDRIHPKYLFYLLCSEDFRAGGIASMTGAGGLRRVADSAVLNYRPSVTDLPTQKAIADFLDRETSRIDQLIEKKQRLVEVLGEREKNRTKRFLSDGLNPNAARMSSKAYYLERFPTHWQVLQLRFLVRIQTGSRDTKDRVDDGSYPLFVRSMKPERINSYSFDGEAVLTSGDGAGVGKVFHHVDERFDLHQRMYAFTGFRKLSGRYFYQFLRCFFAEQMTQWSAKSTVDSVRMLFLKSMLFAVPPRDEQSAILEAIAECKVREDQIAIKTLTSIDRLREFRSALITAAVTGQIDVSTWGKQGTTDRRLDRIEEATSA